jgi:DNA-directed RNA polymerase subunit RPC12/RpoP
MAKKKYKSIDKAFTLPSTNGNGGFPTTCLECGSRLASHNDFNYATEWTAYYVCTKCKAKFAYQPTDMGQSLPWIIKYDEKEEVFRRSKEDDKFWQS